MRVWWVRFCSIHKIIRVSLGSVPFIVYYLRFRWDPQVRVSEIRENMVVPVAPEGPMVGAACCVPTGDCPHTGERGRKSTFVVYLTPWPSQAPLTAQ
jgi:hypothetical protein